MVLCCREYFLIILDDAGDKKGANQSKAKKVELALLASSPLPAILPGGGSV